MGGQKYAVAENEKPKEIQQTQKPKNLHLANIRTLGGRAHRGRSKPEDGFLRRH